MTANDKPQNRWLLLLPPPPHEMNLSSLRVCYGPGLSHCLQTASKLSTGASTLVLDVAIACTNDPGSSYPLAQKLLGLMYRLTCVLCTEQRIDLQYDNDVDVRIIFFQHEEKGTLGASVLLQNSGIDLQTLAKIKRQWQRLCSLESEIGESLLREFIRVRNTSPEQALGESQIDRLPGGMTIRQHPTPNSREEGKDFHRHHSVAVGGTFDHLHAGHKLLLTMTALVLDSEPSQVWCMTVGITGDKLLVNKRYREELQDFEQRLHAIRHFLLDILELILPSHVLEKTHKVDSIGPHGRTVHDVLKSGLVLKYVEIFDPCGPTLTEESITGLIISGETRKGGEVVNEKRAEKGWHALEVFEVDVLDAGEGEAGDEIQADHKFESKISSTEIRRRVLQKSVANGRT